MFPVTIGGATYSLADFYPLGYVTALPNSVASSYDELLKGCTATSTTSMAIDGSGGKVFTIATSLNFRAGQHVMIANTADPSTKYMVCTVTTYLNDHLTVDVVDYLGSGTLSAWTIAPMPAPYTPVPLGISHGGVAGITPVSLLAEAGLAYPKYSMQRVFNDFEGYDVGNGYHGPLYTTTGTDGSVSSEASIWFVPVIDSDVTSTNNPGVLELRALSSPSLRNGYAWAFVGHGKNGYMNAITGGPIEWRSNVRVLYSPDEDNVYITRLGLRGNGSTLGANFLDMYGMGFEFGNSIENGRLCAVLVSRGVRTRVNTGVSLSETVYADLRINVDPYLQIAYWYVNDALVFSASIATWENKAEALLHPAYSFQAYVSDSQSVFFDYLYCTQRVSR